MKNKATLILVTIIFISFSANGQLVQKAEYLKEDVNKYLSNNTEYPVEALKGTIEGDVTYSFTISKNGVLENLAIVKYSNEALLNSSRASLSSLEGGWKPALVNNTPTDRNYQIVFRFRIFFDTEPFDYKGQGNKLFKKQKYEKALKNLDSGIEDNKYDYELYDLRSKVKGALGDSEGAEIDKNTAANLKDQIMAIVDVNVFRKAAPLGVTKTVIVNQ